MKHSFLVKIFLSIGILFAYFHTGYAIGEWDRIDMSVSPIRDEFTATPWTPITRSITYSNNSDTPYAIYITIEDCVPSGNYGTPICRITTGSWVNSEFSSTWITVNEGTFTVPPKTTKTITYTINPPKDATPGWHYGAIFFNNPNTPSPSSNSVGMIRRIGMLYMMNIPGNIVVNSEVGDILVDGTINTKIESPIVFTSAPENIKTLIRNWNNAPMWWSIWKELNPIWEKPTLPNAPFSLTLQVPVKNYWNIHIRPKGKVFLYNEAGEQLKNIWKESIIDENGVYIGEKIVDYLPINDERWNVLPDTDRTFQIQWLGFGYEERDPSTGKFSIKFETPGEYYSRLFEENLQFIYPWDKLSIRQEKEIITAKVEFSYNDITTEKDVTKLMNIPVHVEYSYITKTLNYWVIIITLSIIFFGWILIGKRRKRHPEEQYELEDEIAVLERARQEILAQKKTPKKSSVPSPKKISEKKTTPEKPSPASKTETKKTEPKNPIAKTETAKSWTKKTTPKKTTPEK